MADIQRATNVLVGKPLWRCLRAADMAMFDFGNRKKVPGLRGEWKEVGDFALHVQCAWRLTRQDRVIVGSTDLYYPASYQEDDQVPSDFDWDEEPNLRDKRLVSLFEGGTREFMVEKVQPGLAGSLYISLHDGLSLELFPEHSLRKEHWRLFVPSTEQRHFVV
jgi:hypothetical protein